MISKAAADVQGQGITSDGLPQTLNDRFKSSDIITVLFDVDLFVVRHASSTLSLGELC
jgi:hypothetical protein